MFLPAAHLLFLVAIGGTAWVTDSLMPGGILMVLYALGLWAVAKGWAISQTVETILALGLLPAAWAYAKFKGDAELISFQYWMTLLLAVRSWKVLQRRDYLFSLCMAAGIYTQIGKVYAELPFCLLTILNVVFAPHALHEVFVRFHPVQTRVGQQIQPVREPRLARATSLAGVSLWLILTIALVFLVLPRRGQAIAKLNQDVEARQTGFTDNIALGSFGAIKQNHQIAMRVTTDHPGMWRGAVMDQYRRGVWQSSSAQCRWRKTDEPTALRSGAPSYHHRIHILNLNLVNFHFFSKGDVMMVTRINAPEIIWINDLNGVLGAPLADVRNIRDVEYEIESQESDYFGLPDLTDRRWESPFGQGKMLEKDLYLQIPDDVTPEVRNLAVTITQGLTNEAHKVQAVESYLRRNYTYSLTDLASGNRPPLDYFLFDRKQGHCEYFATAMTMLLRCVGVPSRVVQGFGPGVLVDGEYAVRMSDAHLWVDVFYPGLGWKSHDPTPVTESALAGDLEPGSLWERLQVKWLMVMDYGGTTQLQLLSHMSSWVRWPLVLDHVIRSITIQWRLALFSLVIVVLSGAGWGLWRLIRRLQTSSRGAQASSGGDGIPDYFKRYLQTLARHGYHRGTDATAMELLERLEAEGAPVVSEARFLTALYLRARYRADQHSPQDLAKAKDALRALLRWGQKP